MRSASVVVKIATILRGIPVWSCVRGLRYGDVILRVHGVRVRTSRDAREVARLDPDGTHVTVFRDGAILEVELSTGPRDLARAIRRPEAYPSLLDVLAPN